MKLFKKLSDGIKEIFHRLAVFIICFCVTEALTTAILVVTTKMSFGQCLTAPLLMSILVGGWCSKSSLGEVKKES